MQNGHLENDTINFYEKFATKEEIHLLETQVRDLTKDSAWMAATIKNLDNTVKSLDDTVKEVNKTLKQLLDSKAVNDTLKSYTGKVIVWIGGITGSVVLMHWAGILKMVFKYLTGAI